MTFTSGERTIRWPRGRSGHLQPDNVRSRSPRHRDCVGRDQPRTERLPGSSCALTRPRSKCLQSAGDGHVKLRVQARTATQVGAAVVVPVLLAGCISGPAPSTPGVSASVAEVAFPTEVAGLPVISVAHAADLLQSGQLDGEAAAVAGYFNEFSPSCPAPDRYVGPLESHCSFVALADTRAGATLCESLGSNGLSCSFPAGIHLSPLFKPETSVPASTRLVGPNGEPERVVLIGHAGDARQWQCSAGAQQECGKAFVVDRVAWAQGEDVPLMAPQTGDVTSGLPITATISLEHVSAAVGPENEVLTAAPFRAGDIAAIDPRWNLTVDGVAWLVRSIAQGSSSSRGEAHPEMVWLVDDSTAEVIDSHPLKLDAGYQPARLWRTATVHGLECCAGNVFPAIRVESNDVELYTGLVSSGAMGATDSTTFGGAVGAPPLVLPAGTYSISMWLTTYDNGVMGTQTDGCSTQITLRPLDDITVSADFPKGARCTIGPVPKPSPGP